MKQAVCTARRAAVVIVAGASVGCALFLIWRFVTPAANGLLSNTHLLWLVCLFILPALTLGAWELDRRIALRDAHERHAARSASHHTNSPRRPPEPRRHAPRASTTARSSPAAPMACRRGYRCRCPSCRRSRASV